MMGVSPQRVRAMLAARRLQGRKVGRAWLVSDPERLVRRPRGRPLSAASAWALLALLAGDVPDWADPAVVSRLRRRIRQGRIVQPLKESAPRAVVHHWRVLPQDIDKLKKEFPLVLSGLSARPPELDVVPIGQELDAYLAGRYLPQIERRFRPDRSPVRPNLVLRVPSHRWILEQSDKAPLPVVAADLLLSDDPRVARAAARLLEQRPT